MTALIFLTFILLSLGVDVLNQYKIKNKSERRIKWQH